jgi:hypothetical protein
MAKKSKTSSTTSPKPSPSSPSTSKTFHSTESLLLKAQELISSVQYDLAKKFLERAIENVQKNVENDGEQEKVLKESSIREMLGEVKLELGDMEGGRDVSFHATIGLLIYWSNSAFIL